MAPRRRFSDIRAAAALIVGIGRTLASHADPAPSETFCAQSAAQARANCRLVVDFYETFFNRHQVKAADAAVAETYIQHNPDLPNGRRPLVEFFAGYFRDHPQTRSRILHVGASGDLVWLHVHDTDAPGERGDAVVDIFRVQAGRIVEHWDVIQPIPAKAVNPKPMF
jgi:predicted SnoaL-like aldol condensation-catalyzing enzyme